MTNTKYLLIAAVSCICIVAASCRIVSFPSSSGYPTRPEVIQQSDNRAVYFQDDKFRDEINRQLGKPDGSVITAGELSRMYSLSLNYKGITSIVGIEYCTSMLYFSAIHNEITDISPLSGCNRLTQIRLSGNNISDLTPLKNPNAQNIRRLWLGNNSIESIEGLENKPALEALYIENNKIKDIAPVLNNTKLLHLNIRNNNLSDVSKLAALKSLIVVDISGNKNITDLSGFAGAADMLEFYATDCGIIDISAAAAWTKLKTIRLSGNAIYDISALVTCFTAGAFSQLNANCYIELQGNPLGFKALNSDIPVFKTAGVAIYY